MGSSSSHCLPCVLSETALGRGICIRHHFVAAVVELQAAFYASGCGLRGTIHWRRIQIPGRSTIDPILHVAGTRSRYRAPELFCGCWHTAGQVPVVDGWRQDQLEEQPAAAWAWRQGINRIIMKPVDTGNVRSFADLVGRCFRNRRRIFYLSCYGTLTGGWVAGRSTRTCGGLPAFCTQAFDHSANDRASSASLSLPVSLEPLFLRSPGCCAWSPGRIPRYCCAASAFRRGADFPRHCEPASCPANPVRIAVFRVLFIATAGVPVDPISEGASSGN